MSAVLVLFGLALIVVGVARGRGPYLRYTALKEQDANIERYEQWRGGIRSDGKTGASVAMEILRRQVQIAVAVVIAGFVLVAVGFVIR